MGKSSVDREVWLSEKIQTVFSFFADATNLQKLTPDWLHFRVLTPPPLEMHAGALIDYRLRVRGVPIRWRSQILAWEPPFRFVDKQVHGPYKQWIHEHLFTSLRGGTLVQDKVDYAVLGGPLVDRCLVAPDLRRIFDFRHKQLQKYFQPILALPNHTT